MKKVIIAILIMMIIIWGCKANNPTKTTTTTTQMSKVTLKCNEGKGKYAIEEEKRGPVEYCTLPDGTKCEAWAYYNEECPPATTTTEDRCRPCPEYIPPSPDFCKDGQIIPDQPDECGCIGPPNCLI